MFRDNSIKGAQAYFSDKLNEKFDSRTIRTFFQWTCEDLFGLTANDLLLGTHRFGESELLQFRTVAKQLLSGVPIQYILRSADFYGRKFYVAPGVLIPRPETERIIELVAELTTTKSVLDIGCGSGIIPVTLKLEHPKWEVFACDISDAAIEVTKKNAEQAAAAIEVFKCDILQEGIDRMFDLIVSNPPYVLETDRKEMAQHVLEHEPDIALFVPDNDPLLFYKVLADIGLDQLNLNGTLVVEIHEAFGEEVSALFRSVGYADVTIHQDLQSKDRFVSAKLLQ